MSCFSVFAAAATYEHVDVFITPKPSIVNIDCTVGTAALSSDCLVAAVGTDA
jgi:hypothetical protein